MLSRFFSLAFRLANKSPQFCGFIERLLLPLKLSTKTKALGSMKSDGLKDILENLW